MPRTFNVLALAAALAAPVIAGKDSCWIEKDANVCVDKGYYSHGSGYYQQSCGVKFDPKDGSWPLNGDEGDDCDTFEKCLDICDEKGAVYAVYEAKKCKVYSEGDYSYGGDCTVGKVWGPENPCEEKATTTSWWTTNAWENVKPTTTPWKGSCDPWTEEYVCDDDEEGEYTTTLTHYSKGCPGWVEPTSTDEWLSWPTDDAGHYKKPKGHKGPKDDDKDNDDSWSTWVDPKPVKTTDVWNTWVDPKPTTETWVSWPKTTDPAKWEDVEYDEEGKKIVVITYVEEWEVPCSTGWEKHTTTIYGKHCGCTETPVPKHPAYSTYTTECPESWGVGKTVTVTVPYATWTPKKVAAETTTWATWSEVVAPSVTTSASWSAWTGVDAAKCSLTTSTWTTTECGGSTSTWADCKPVTKTATITPASCYPDNGVSWGVWATSTKPAPAASSTAWSPVAVWKGAAPNNAVNKVMVVLAGAAAGVAFVL